MEKDGDDVTGAFDYVANQLPDTGDFLFNHAVKTPVWAMGGAVGFMAYQAWNNWSVRKALLDGNFKGPEAVVTYSLYDDFENADHRGTISGTQQRIRNAGKVDIGQFFPEQMRGVAVGVINRATRYCTPEEPSPIQHLDKVFEEKSFLDRILGKDFLDKRFDRDAVKVKVIEAIEKGFQNGVGSLLRDPRFNREAVDSYFAQDDALSETRQPGFKPVEGEAYGTLVFETNAQVTRPRLFINTRPMLDRLPEISPDTMHIETRTGDFTYNPGHTHNVRLSTNQTLARDIADRPDVWAPYRVAFPVGYKDPDHEAEVASPE